MEIIGIKYLKYEIKKQAIEGISHKRACLSYLLADSIIENKIPVIHKSQLESHHGMRTDQEFISTYMIGDYYKIPYRFVYEEDVDDDVLIKSFEHDSFWDYDDLSDELIELTSKIHGIGGIGMKNCIPIWEPSDFIKNIGDKILNSLERPLIGIHLRKPAFKLNDPNSWSNGLKTSTGFECEGIDSWDKNTDGIEKILDDMKIESLVSKLKNFDWKNMFIGCITDVINRNDKVKMMSDYNYVFENNYYRFLVEQYVIDNSDISIRTWKDSTIHFKKESVGENYYLFDIHMDEIHTGKYVWHELGRSSKLYPQKYEEEL